MGETIVVTGMGIVSPLGVGKRVNGDNLRRGLCALRAITSFDTSRYLGNVGGECKDFDSTGRLVDRATRLLFAAADEAVSDAAIDLTAGGNPLRRSVVTSTTLAGMNGAGAYLRSNSTRVSALRDYLASTQLRRLAKRLDFRGNSLAISNACSSGTNVIEAGRRLLLAGISDVVVVAGYEAMSEFVTAGFHSMRVVSPDLCAPFSEGRNGLQLGEGAGAMVLESAQSARERKSQVYAEIAGYGESSDMFHMTKPHPEGRGAALAMARALADAVMRPEEIGYINAHGTGTKSNDSAEVAALKSVFGRHLANIPVSSSKSQIGHLLGAAGTVESILSILAMNGGFLPPTLNLGALAPECAGIDPVANTAREWNYSSLISCSFGFGGCNSAVIFRKSRQ